MLINCKRGKAISLPFQTVATPSYPRCKGNNKKLNKRMIRQKIKLEKYNWYVYVYCAVTTYYIDEILEHLWEIGIDGDSARRAYESMSKGDLDSGLCYSNYGKRKTVIVVAKTSSSAEFLNSLTHEASHACVHIASASYVDLKSEEYAYMVGDLCMAIYPKVKHLLCNCCRTKKENHYGS